MIKILNYLLSWLIHEKIIIIATHAMDIAKIYTVFINMADFKNYSFNYLYSLLNNENSKTLFKRALAVCLNSYL